MSGKTDRSRLALTFGRQVFAYCCNVLVDRVDELLRGDAQDLSAKQSAVLQALIELLDRVAARSRETGTPPLLLLESFPLFEGERAIFSVLRAEAGGAFPDVLDLDPVLRSLKALAVDAYPLMLVAAETADRETYSPIVTLGALAFRHPAHEQLTNAILGDDELSRLFPTRGADSLQTMSDVACSTGRAGSVQLGLLPSLIIGAAWRLALLRSTVDLEGLLGGIEQLLSTLRSAAGGETATVPVYVGFNNVLLEQGTSIETPWGTIRNCERLQFALVPPGARPSQVGGDPRFLGVVLDTTSPYEIQVRAWSPGDEATDLDRYRWPDRMLRDRQELDLVCERIALACALGVERTPPPGLTRAWTIIVDPLDSGSFHWRPRIATPVPYCDLSSDDASSVAAWTNRLAASDDRSIAVAIRRLVSAVSTRQDPVDGFIDAVIAWENLFGSRDGELTFRISSAMASLLHEPGETRLRKQRDISRLYGVRSRVVHGGEELDAATAIESRDQALELAVSCMRRLYVDHPDLIHDKDRAKSLILTL